MAFVASGEFGKPVAQYEIYAEQTGGSGNQRTVRITFKIKIKSSSSESNYGFPLNWKARIHNSYSDWMFVKDSSYWYGGMGWQSYSWTHTVDVGTTNAANITVGFELDYPKGSSSWEQTRTGTFQVEQTNVAPTQPGWIQVRANSSDGPLLNGQINENINNFYITWGASSDGNGDTIYYDLQEQRNGGSWTSIDGHGTDTAHQFWTTGGEGTTYYYGVNARDNKGGESDWTYSGTITKNVFTMATLNSNSSISYSADPLYFTYTGGSNTQDGIGVRYQLSCNEVTVYNGDWFTTGSKVMINWGQSGGTTGTYINWNDIKSYFSNKQGVGTLTFVLTGTNDNGTVKHSQKTINVNIQTTPNGAKSPYISTDPSESTAYKNVGGSRFFIPDGSSRIRVKWGAADSKAGETVRYRVYVSNNGGWTELATTTSLYYDHVIPKQNHAQRFSYKIRALSGYNEGLYTDQTTSEQTIHYYNSPTFSKGSVIRTASSAEVQIIVKVNSSISSIGVSGRWSAGWGGSAGSGSLQSTQSPQTIRLTGLSETGTYSLNIWYNDTSGLSSEAETIVYIGANLPVFFVNQNGIGVGGLKANQEQAVRIQGALGQFAGSVSDYENFDDYTTEGEYSVGINNGCANGPFNEQWIYGKLIVKVNDGGTHNNSNNWIWQYFLCANGENNKEGVYARRKINSYPWSSWKRISGTESLTREHIEAETDYYYLPNGAKLYVAWYTIQNNNTRTITLPSGGFSSYTSPPMICNWVPDKDWRNFSTSNEISISRYTTKSVDISNWNDSKTARVMIWMIGE